MRKKGWVSTPLEFFQICFFFSVDPTNLFVG
ncbi:hypothetical protein ACMTAS_0968 [Thermotoga neapolitana DSM 4359]